MWPPVSQALDILMSEEMIPDTEMSETGHMNVSEHSSKVVNDDENGMTSMECKQLKRGYDDDDDITQERIQIKPQITTTQNPL